MHNLLNALGAHPHDALLLVALVALAESLAIIGTFVPAAIVMFSAGVLVGNGSLDLWTTLACAVLGAVIGDALSYELGRRHQARVRAWPMFQRHASAVARGEAFLRNHGGMSVVLARFTGAVRSFVPLLAGFADMPPARFYTVNIISALLWAPAHILPGVLFGSSLQLAEAVSGRLALIALFLVLLVWFVVWLVSTTVRVVVPRGRRLRDAAVERMRGQKSFTARATLALLDPQRSDSGALLLGTVLLLAAGWLFLGVVEDVLFGDPLVQLDQSVFHLLQGLRFQSADRWMVAITEMGSVGVLLPLILVVLAWLVWRRCWRTAAYWAGSAVVGELLVQLLKFTLGRQRPQDLYRGVEQFSFPSGHATVSTVVLAFLAFLLSRGRTLRVRLAIAVAAGIYVALVAFSRLYLGAHWFSDVVGGMSLGLAWVAFVAMVYTRHPVREHLAPRGLMLAAVACLVIAGGVWNHWNAARDLSFYATVPRREVMTYEGWLTGGWQQLPARRLEMAGDLEEPLQLQWACGEADIVRELRGAGWQNPPAWSVAKALASIAPRASIHDLPVLPRLNRGDRSRLAFVRPSADGADEREVLRLWRSDFEIRSGDVEARPIWYGAVYREVRRGNGRFTGNLLVQSVAPLEAIVPLLPSGVDKQIRILGVGRPPTVLIGCAG